jgi:hypothetical protein
MKLIDLTGRKFGHLTVIDRKSIKKKVIGTLWRCKCSCGNICETRSDRLRGGLANSCGCQGSHGMCGTPEYMAWHSMRMRCKPDNSDLEIYKNYAGRGIEVCERWNDFFLFYEDMGPRPGPDYSIDRIDNDGNYCPENCRWATRKEQMNNTRWNCVVAVEGIESTFAQACERYGKKPAQVRGRISRGWNLEKAFTMPDGRYKIKEVL